MPTKRDWLVERGLAKPGRGKFSNAAKEALVKAKAEGVVFDDDAKPTARPAAPKPAAEPKAEQRTGVGLVEYLFPSDFRYPEADWQAVERRDGKRIVHSVREVCNTCRVSLTAHGCANPTILGNITVTMERRKVA